MAVCVVDGTYEATITRLDVRQVEKAREKVAEDRTRHRIRVERRSILDTVAGDLLPAARSVTGRQRFNREGCWRGAHCPWKPCSTWCAFWFIIVPETSRGWLLSSWQASVGNRSASAAQRGDSRCCAHSPGFAGRSRAAAAGCRKERRCGTCCAAPSLSLSLLPS